MNISENLEKAIRAIPEVKKYLASVADDEHRAAVVSRNMVLNQINEVEAKREKLRAEANKRKAAASAIREKFDEAMRAVREIEAEEASLSGQYSRLHKDLRKNHGEAYAVDAQTKLLAMRRHLSGEVVRLEGLAHRIVEVAPGYRRKIDSPEHQADLAEMRRDLAQVDDAIEQIGKLLCARIHPDELRQQAERILALVA